MKRITLISFAIGLALSALSCSDDDLMYNVHQKRSVYFDREKVKQILFFSLFVSVEGDDYDYCIPIRVIGKPVNEVQHPVVMVVADSSTARENMHYVMGEVVIPADSVRGVLNIRLNKTGDMKERSYFLFEICRG